MYLTGTHHIIPCVLSFPSPFDYLCWRLDYPSNADDVTRISYNTGELGINGCDVFLVVNNAAYNLIENDCSFTSLTLWFMIRNNSSVKSPLLFHPLRTGIPHKSISTLFQCPSPPRTRFTENPSNHSPVLLQYHPTSPLHNGAVFRTVISHISVVFLHKSTTSATDSESLPHILKQSKTYHFTNPMWIPNRKQQ